MDKKYCDKCEKEKDWEKEFDEEFEDCKTFGFPITTKTRLKSFIRQLLEAEKKKWVKEKDLITIGYYKGEMDFGVNCSVAGLSLKELNELREMIIVAIWSAEDMWRRNQKEEIGSQLKSYSERDRENEKLAN